jgi:hypothetical protein
MSEAQPMKFIYNEEVRELVVEFGDGSIVKYFALEPPFSDPLLGFSDLSPRLAFLDPFNPRCNRDFVTWSDQRMHALHCSQRGAPAGPWMCDCRRIVKSEVIQEATEQLNEPSTRTATFLNRMQNSQGSAVTIPNWPLNRS